MRRGGEGKGMHTLTKLPPPSLTFSEIDHVHMTGYTLYTVHALYSTILYLILYYTVLYCTDHYRRRALNGNIQQRLGGYIVESSGKCMQLLLY